MVSPNLLIIENNIGDVLLVKLALKQLGIQFDISNVDTAEEGLDFLHHRGEFSMVEGLPKLIITDLSMPGIGGIDFLRIVKKNPAFKNIPVAIMTTSAKESDKKLCLDLGAERFIIKPLYLEEYLPKFTFVRDFFRQQVN